MLFGSVQSHSRVWFFAKPAALQASLSITNSQSLLKLISIESVMPSNHLIFLSSPSPSAFNLSQHQGLFQWVGSSHQVAKVLELQLHHQSFHWPPRTDLLSEWLIDITLKLSPSVCSSSYQGSARPSFYAADIIQFINNLFKILPDQSL